MRQCPRFWLTVTLTIALMMMTAVVTFLINERQAVGLGVVVVIGLIFWAGVYLAEYGGSARRTRKKRVPMPQFVANEAMRRAKYSAERGRPGLCDVGVLAYRDGGDPEVYRRQAVRGSARQLRPYVVLHWGGLLAGETEVQFALEDGAGQPCFEVTQPARLARGRNFITPAAWLPIVDEDGGESGPSRDGRWRLTVLVDGVAVAVHPFQVKAPVRSELSGAITDDGEIEPDLTPEWADEPLSLKDLLAGNPAAGKNTKS